MPVRQAYLSASSSKYLVVGVLGRQGVGKSTLLNALASAGNPPGVTCSCASPEHATPSRSPPHRCRGVSGLCDGHGRAGAEPASLHARYPGHGHAPPADDSAGRPGVCRKKIWVRLPRPASSCAGPSVQPLLSHSELMEMADGELEGPHAIENEEQMLLYRSLQVTLLKGGSGPRP